MLVLWKMQQKFAPKKSQNTAYIFALISEANK
jgi:hypothetical protein